MTYPRDINFEILVDNALTDSNGIYEDAVNRMSNGLPSTCSGEWVFIVNSTGNIHDSTKFCAKYDAVDKTYFNATWKRPGGPLSHEVLLFAPK